ncbi:MAG TPA: hypothetical protein VGL09_19160, partial [Methylomirabilota bacterium]
MPPPRRAEVVVASDSLSIAALRYIVIPALGVIVAFLVAGRREDVAEPGRRRLCLSESDHAWRQTVRLAIGLAALFLLLLTLRYGTWHSFV